MEEKEDLGEHSWISTVKFLIDYCNMNDIWLHLTEMKNDTIASKCCNILMSKMLISGTKCYKTLTQAH